jgi:uncharacterized protein (DUF2235 family)
MPKNIVFCADGTWNGPSEVTGVSVTDTDDTAGEVKANAGNVTNVFTFFNDLLGHITPATVGSLVELERIATDDNGAVLQVAKYLHGVGDSTNLIVKILGGAFGFGIISRIVRGYTYISRSYSAADAIYVVGFSRGAYTARALAGMICKVGLLNPATYDPSDKELAYRLGIAAWIKWRQIALSQGVSSMSPPAIALLTFLEHFAAADLPLNGLLPDIPIKTVGVWDTVGSLGIPLYAGGAQMDVFRFADTALNPLVENGFHAMAAHERRADFPVTTWDTRVGIVQEWFIGAHSDVGGGYPASESGLSNQALSWILRRLADSGVRLNSPVPYPPLPQSPNQAIHTPWDSPPFNLLPLAQRLVDRASDLFHVSVTRRDALVLPPGPPPLGPQDVAKLRIDPAEY